MSRVVIDYRLGPGAELRGANLGGADLRWKNLDWSDMSGAYLTYANLHGASLVGADLRGADLYGAHLAEVDLSDADLQGADLRGTCLTRVKLRGAALFVAKFDAHHFVVETAWGTLVVLDEGHARACDVRAFCGCREMRLSDDWAGIARVERALRPERFEYLRRAACAWLGLPVEPIWVDGE